MSTTEQVKDTVLDQDSDAGHLLLNEPLADYKTWRVGGAVVSEKHANFIINHQGTASANDIESLIQFVQKTVYEQTAIEWIREVHIIGDKWCSI